VTPSQQRAQDLAAFLLDNGWKAHGATREEHVRIPTAQNPVYGASGGEPRTLGGRARFARGARRCTVGAVTTCFYRTLANGGLTGFESYKTSSVDKIRQRALAGDHDCTKCGEKIVPRLFPTGTHVVCESCGWSNPTFFDTGVEGGPAWWVSDNGLGA